MKIDFQANLTFLCAAVCRGLLASASGCAAGPAETSQEPFWIESFHGDSEKVLKPYDDFYYYNRNRAARAMASPAPAFLPESLDTYGNWGQPADGLRVSVRLHRREFARGEPVGAMVLLRNLASAGRVTRFWAGGHMNFDYIVHHGTDKLITTWIPPTVPNPAPIGYSPSTLSALATITGHNQVAFFVQLDRIFDLSQVGEYSVQVIRGERLSTGQGTTNLLSGTATFRIVDRLSEAEMQATNDFVQNLQRMQKDWQAALRKSQVDYVLSHGLTNEPVPR